MKTVREFLSMWRGSIRSWLVAAVAALWTGSLSPAFASDARPAAAGDGTLLFSRVVEAARTLAARPYEAPARPASGGELTYDQYRAIRFKPSRDLWADGACPFRVQFFPCGFYYREPVKIDETTAAGGERAIPFSKDFFSWDMPGLEEKATADLGFAGLRILFHLNDADRWDEVISFLGASYFRALGRDQVYGLSARGLAVNTGQPGPEEFPRFREFWLERPAPGARSVTVCALLDGPSLAGAYRFTVEPGEETVVEVRATVFPRRTIEVLGLAPMSSMFLHGKDSPRPPTDFRPEVHDSDGLLMADASGGWTWRPLHDPPATRVSHFPMSRPVGFGLMQRDRNFDHYQDLEAVYQKRSSLWVEVMEPWPAGSLELLEIATSTEHDDNIAPFWKPAEPAQPGAALSFGYRLRWMLGTPAGDRLGRVIATRSEKRGVDSARFFIDFEGPALEGLDGRADLVADVAVEGGEAGPAVVQKNPFNGSWRLFFDVRSTRREGVEMRALLRNAGAPVTETWSCPWAP